MQVDQQVAKKCLILKVTNYTLSCNLETSLKRPERSQRHLQGDVFNTSHGRRLRDLRISPLWDVSETLHETSQRCIWDVSMPAGLLLITDNVAIAWKPFQYFRMIKYWKKHQWMRLIFNEVASHYPAWTVKLTLL